MSDEDVNIRIPKKAHTLLKEIRKILKSKGFGGREASLKRIVESALIEYKKKLEEEK